MKIEKARIESIRLNEANPRTIKDDRYAALLASIRDFPEMLKIRPIVVNEKMEVLGGNMRLRACIEAGMDTVYIIRASELSEEQQRRFIVVDNVGFGEWNWDVLANEWDAESVADWGLDIPDFEMKGSATEEEATEDDYEIPETIKTDIVRGDLFEIGPHRLLCGDSTNADDVLRLMEGAQPYLMITDPPYGVEYDANWRNEADRANGKPYGARAVGKVINDEKADWSSAWALAPSKVAYVWHADRHAMTVQSNLNDAQFEVRNQIIWAKSNFAISRGHYHWKHEPCWYAVKKGAKSQWIGDHSQTTLWEIAKPQKSETGHSTQKPVECMARPIRNHEGDVYDPFLGSGTTMVAAHQLNRRCYGMEIDEKYCQVIVDRMLKLDPTLEIKRNGVPYKSTQIVSA